MNKPAANRGLAKLAESSALNPHSFLLNLT